MVRIRLFPFGGLGLFSGANLLLGSVTISLTPSHWYTNMCTKLPWFPYNRGLVINPIVGVKKTGIFWVIIWPSQLWWASDLLKKFLCYLLWSEKVTVTALCRETVSKIFPHFVRIPIIEGRGPRPFTHSRDNRKTQGIVGCTPTNVPLWEIPI